MPAFDRLPVGEPRVCGTLLQDTLKHIHVSLDTRLPASYGPEVRYRTPSPLCVIIGQWFLIDAPLHRCWVEAGEVVLSYQDLTRQDVEEEPTGMYLWRVLVRQYHLPSAPQPCR